MPLYVGAVENVLKIYKISKTRKYLLELDGVIIARWKLSMASSLLHHMQLAPIPAGTLVGERQRR